MKGDTPVTVFLKDYTQPDYLIDTVELRFRLAPTATQVASRLAMRRNTHTGAAQPLLLQGEALQLQRVLLEGRELVEGKDYLVTETELQIPQVPDEFVLEVETRIDPQANLSLSGLYRSSGIYCTQCEAEGFRRITYFLDRPDVMARYTTTIVADAHACPVMLSNGNLVAQGVNDDGTHWVTWEDPFKKPSYLFALVAGDLGCVEDSFTTASGREVSLHIYVEHENIDRCAHAMRALKNAMRWDEEQFGLEYDLDRYMIVAVNDFNMGAMENKGLNVFNSKCVLAKPETATDSDFQSIEGVIAHEYFHNWTGNRVTCRDWFQLSLKEGLTVYRDQEFSADLNSRAVARISDVRMLRATQFLEDAGPMAHPVRPDSYVEINNFYTATVYNKGAEVVRMYETLFGKDGFRRGMDLYFERHDGQAVTTDDFFNAMVDANGRSGQMEQFKRWYSQAGTPEVTVETEYTDSRLVIHLHQSCPPTPGQQEKQPFLIPLRIGFLDAAGEVLLPAADGEEVVKQGEDYLLLLSRSRQSFVFTGFSEQPVVSLLRGFSAPIKLHYARSDRELGFLLAHDRDAFSRWEAGQELATREILNAVDRQQQGRVPQFGAALTDACRQLLQAYHEDPAFVAEALVLPGEGVIAEQMEVIDVERVHQCRQLLRRHLAEILQPQLHAIYEEYSHQRGYAVDAGSIGRRRLKNQCLGLLMELDDEEINRLCLHQFKSADNMTDALAALTALVNSKAEGREEALEDFYRKWKHDALVMDKWLTVQATCHFPGAIEQVKKLIDDPVFDDRNPNKVRALVGAFCHTNAVNFHAADGTGYEFAADWVLKLDAQNPQIAAGVLKSLTRWRRYDEKRQQQMRRALERILAHGGLSKDCYEIASKSL